MAYTKTVWVNDSKPAINADNLNKIEQGIIDNETAITEETSRATAAESSLSTKISAILPASSGTAGQVLTKTATGADWQDVDGVPSGGTTGQVLAKKSTASYDTEWVNLASNVKSYTLSASSWNDGSYTISDSLITATSNQEILPAVGITLDQLKALQTAMLVDGGQSAGSLTLKALGTVPTIDIPIRIIYRGEK